MQDLPDLPVIIDSTGESLGKRRKDFPMKVRINNFAGYRYRRYAAALAAAAVAWFPYAASTFFIFPSWEALAAAVLLTAGGCVPLVLLAGHCLAVAEDHFSNERAKHARSTFYAVD